ncbi:4-hydroxyphenylacetate 3-hydroxylase N-terminal domain-containing protein [Enterocloster citroniae]|uniref:4-hydroxyphenylacetate 3-hydroxylase N-terminal domain-containing protein n=1 Tax=Enterocloster citroniae TaxID=358743 RepID=UPI00349ECACA
MAIGTYEQYKERLLKMKPNVYLNGTCVDRSNGKEGPERDLADWIKGGTYVMKQCYDVANDPDYADVCITTSHITGEKINRCTHIHHSQEDLLKKQLMTRLICHRVGGCMQRCMGTDAMNALFSVTYDCDQACGTEYHQRLLNYIEYCQKYDLICNCAQTDVKGSRNPKYKRAYMQPDPDSFVHVVDTDVDGIGVDGKPCKGIIVRGAKICNSNAPYVDEIIVNPTKFMGPDAADYAVAFALPGDWDGVKLMALPGLHHKRTHLEAPIAKIGDVESLTIFDDCFVPYDRVFMCGRDNEGVPRYAGYLALMFAHYHRHSYTGCKTAVSEVIASQAALVADVNDIARESHVREKLCDIIQTAELVFAAGEASAYHATQFPSGQWVPDEVLTNAGRRLAGHNIYHEYETLADLTGGVCASLPTEESFFAPETAELCNKYIRRNPAYSAEDTHRVMRMMENKLCDSYEAAQAVAGVHGGGSPLMETITMMSRYDLEELKKIAKYLAGIPGYGECPRYERSAHTATPRAMLAKFDAMAAAKKETK